MSIDATKKLQRTIRLNELLLSAFKNALDAQEDPVVILDKRWRYIFINKAGYAEMRRSPEDVLDKNIWELYPFLLKTQFGLAAKRSMKMQIVMEIIEYYPHRAEHFRVQFYPAAHSMAVHISNITDLVQAQSINTQLLGELQDAMEVYWSKENQAFRQRRKKSIEL
jgi:PAS domain-containing protein